MEEWKWIGVDMVGVFVYGVGWGVGKYNVLDDKKLGL